MTSAKEAAEAVMEAYKAVRPVEAVFMDRFKAFQEAIQAFKKEKGWFNSNSDYCVIAEVYIYARQIEFTDEGVWVSIQGTPMQDYRDEPIFITYEAIDTPVETATKEYNKYQGKRIAMEKAFARANRGY